MPLTPRRSRTRAVGFTLLEVMTVTAIVAILAAIALPSYLDYVRRGYIQEGTTALSDGRVKMEQFFQDNRTYLGGPCPGDTKYFTMTCSGLSATAFLITASGKDSVLNFNYTINEGAVRTSTTPWGNGATCWIIRKGDTC